MIVLYRRLGKTSFELILLKTQLTLLIETLKKIHQWSVNWLVKFNPQKTETMVISRKLIKPPHRPEQLIKLAEAGVGRPKAF
jgi:hypothetical protein